MLLIDADPQADMTKSLGVEDPDELDITLQVLLQVGKRSLGTIYYRNLTRLILTFMESQEIA